MDAKSESKSVNKLSGIDLTRNWLGNYWRKPVWIPLTPVNRSKRSKAISDTPLIFGAVWDNSFRWALTLLDPKPDVIFFMTDGSANRKGMDIIRQHHGSTKINTISYLAPAQAKISLKEIAKMTGGEFRSIDAAQIKQLSVRYTLNAGSPIFMVTPH